MPFTARLAAAGLLALSFASAASARPGGWDGPGAWGSGWGGSGWGAREWANSRWDSAEPGRGRDDREGKVEVASFVADDAAAAALGHGRIAVALQDQPDSQRLATPVVPGASYEAAVIDQMVHAGYDTSGTAGSEDQVVELTLDRSVLTAAEKKRNPVSGEMEMGVSNRGTMMGLGINLDFSKPKGALVSTRMEARIRDKASGKVLWEGRADIATRNGDDDWGEQSIAVKLAGELFKRFPGSTEKPSH
ncbi:MAG: hypothetical protein P0Y56_12295 [Candidatus Andeanibacterium colombiense]|uniref:DUF4136 domain-containing protein n=1 Tax=Candidatus Andeanibacterium colombiense TaxID=3121345 RepID=A0AAJ6BLX3_9SPHN|nr:MAG: hypothetical protein P0Y56_12295 [Sphingomonadaceae bacterium]